MGRTAFEDWAATLFLALTVVIVLVGLASVAAPTDLPPGARLLAVAGLPFGTVALVVAVVGLRAARPWARQAAVVLLVALVISGAVRFVASLQAGVMIPLEAIVTELVLSGEVERTYRLLREQGFVRQMEYHSPTSQYGQLSRRGKFDHLDVTSRMRELVEDITSGRFADEWDHERSEGHKRLAELKAMHCSPDIQSFEEDLRRKLGPGARSSS